MTLKLLKYEFKNNYKRYMSVYIATLVLALVMGLSTPWMSKYDSTIFSIIFGLFFFLFVGLIIACGFVSVFLAVRNYHYSMFKSESYITHAVPATTNEILIAKILGATIWNIISVVVIILSLIIYFFTTAAVTDISSVFQSIRQLFGAIYFEDVMDLIVGLLKYTPVYLTSAIAMFLTFFFCDTIVQTQKTPNHRILISVIIFIAISMIISFITNQLIMPMFDLAFAYPSQSAIILKSTLFNILQIVVFYIGCKVIIDKKMDI